MELSSQRQQTLRHQFDAFCKKVVRYEMINCYREQERRRNRQVLFSEMSEAEFNLLATFDEYFTEEYVFCVIGFNIPVKNELLAEALITLSAEKRNIILMYYYLGMNDREISEVVKRRRNTVSYQRIRALRLMREYLEARYGE